MDIKESNLSVAEESHVKTLIKDINNKVNHPLNNENGKLNMGDEIEQLENDINNTIGYDSVENEDELLNDNEEVAGFKEGEDRSQLDVRPNGGLEEVVDENCVDKPFEKAAASKETAQSQFEESDVDGEKRPKILGNQCENLESMQTNVGQEVSRTIQCMGIDTSQSENPKADVLGGEVKENELEENSSNVQEVESAKSKDGFKRTDSSKSQETEMDAIASKDSERGKSTGKDTRMDVSEIQETQMDIGQCEETGTNTRKGDDDDTQRISETDGNQCQERERSAPQETESEKYQCKESGPCQSKEAQASGSYENSRDTTQSDNSNEGIQARITPCSFASISGENSKDGETSFVNASLSEPDVTIVSDTDPFAGPPIVALLGSEGFEECETITGDKTISEEQNDKQVRSEHAYTLPPEDGSSDEVHIVSETSDAYIPKKTIKVLYPKKKVSLIDTPVSKVPETIGDCLHCSKVGLCTMKVEVGGSEYFLCSEKCLMGHRSVQKAVANRPHTVFTRKCSECSSLVVASEKNLSWETMDFCQEECLGRYQNKLGSSCAQCKADVQSGSLGKYCVRFGSDVKQFCRSPCLEEYKKGVKNCYFCQLDMNNVKDGFLAPIGDKGQFKDFCTKDCMEKYDWLSQNAPFQMTVHQCDVCTKLKVVQVEVLIDSKLFKLCSDICFAAFKFVNSIDVGYCDMCRKYFDKNTQEELSIFFEDTPLSFCSKICMNVCILAQRRIVSCDWCKVKKYNFDMIRRSLANGQPIMLCSLNCLALYKVSVTAVSTKKVSCDQCKKLDQAHYHLTMSDATIRNFCGYQCVLSFQAQFKKAPLTLPAQPIPTGGPKRILPKKGEAADLPGSSSMPVISSVGTLAKAVPEVPIIVTTKPDAAYSDKSRISKPTTVTSGSVKGAGVKVIRQVLIRPPKPPEMKNKLTQTNPKQCTKGISCKPLTEIKNLQTEEEEKSLDKILVAVPVPIYIPVPVPVENIPQPLPIPLPIPVPLPVFIPTQWNSAAKIMQEIKRIQDKTPADPFEAELLMMAEMVAEDKKDDSANSQAGHESGQPPTGVSGGNSSFGPSSGGGEGMVEGRFADEELLQALNKMATELEEPSVDLEDALASHNHQENEIDTEGAEGRSKKRNLPQEVHGGVKRIRRSSPPPSLPRAKLDADMCLKFTLGVSAWKQWVTVKNTELEKTCGPKVKLLKSDLLQLTADELNLALSLFVNEVRKPTGEEYTPDTVYYLCLGIQQYLFISGRIDNIFTDSFYDKFTDSLNEIANRFMSIYDDRQYIVTRVEEEHLWESRQLGAHSPYVLLSTLLYFNTKHFCLTTVEEHMQLSFSHIMKHWKKGGGPSSGGTPAGALTPGTTPPSKTRNFILRFFPPQHVLDANTQKKKMYEQQENEENPLRCPVKLYEFYLSKCPESVKARSDLFYLAPERSCVPDSPVWYSTSALGQEVLSKMLNRIKMVKEVNLTRLSP